MTHEMVDMGDESASRRMRSDRHSPGRHCNRVRRPPGITARLFSKERVYIRRKSLRQGKIDGVSSIIRARRETEGTKIKMAATGNKLKRTRTTMISQLAEKRAHYCRFVVPALIDTPFLLLPSSKLETRSCLAHIPLHHLLFLFV